MRDATEGGLPTIIADLMSRKPCARCHGPLGNAYHTGWDPAGVICENCWYTDAEQDLARQYREEWERDQKELRECGG